MPAPNSIVSLLSQCRLRTNVLVVILHVETFAIVARFASFNSRVQYFAPLVSLSVPPSNTGRSFMTIYNR